MKITKKLLRKLILESEKTPNQKINNLHDNYVVTTEDITDSLGFDSKSSSKLKILIGNKKFAYVWDDIDEDNLLDYFDDLKKTKAGPKMKLNSEDVGEVELQKYKSGNNILISVEMTDDMGNPSTGWLWTK